MSRIASVVLAFLKQILSLLRTTKPLENRRAAVFAFFILGVWLAAVVFTETRHEFWRDEVRALSLARESVTPLDLYQSVQYDGHPLVWYLILYAGKSIVNTPLVLPIAAVAVGFAAVAIFFLFAPMPLWLKSLFIFSSLPFYEYSVMARNYGISMLLLFAVAVLYPHREKLGLWLAVALALLANTNAHSVVFAGLIAAIWIWDAVVERRAALTPKKALTLGLFLVIISGGIAFCAVCVLPRENTILTPIRQTLTWPNFLEALTDSALHPEKTLDRILPEWVPPAAAAALFILAMLGLANRPLLLLAALSGEIALGILFRLVYAGDFRHQGLFVIFLFFLYWMFIDSRGKVRISRAGSLLFHAGLYLALLSIVAAGILQMRGTAWRDVHMEMSSSKALGGFLTGDPSYRDAILLPEPDYILEPVAYYADNDIYLPREKRFGKTVSWTKDASPSLSLGELMADARELQNRYGKPVLIILGHFNIDFTRPGGKRYSYNKLFTWDYGSAADFKNSTVLVGNLNRSLEDENYLVYALVEKPAYISPEKENPGQRLICGKAADRMVDLFAGLPFTAGESGANLICWNKPIACGCEY